MTYEIEINDLLTKVYGDRIVKKEFADFYDNIYEKFKRWRGQWQHAILTALTGHVRHHLIF